MELPKRLSVFVLVTVIGCSLSTHAQNPPPISNVEDFATVLITKSPQERTSLLSTKKELMTPDLRKALIREGNIHLMAGRYSTAFDIYGLAQNIAEQIGDKEGVASASLDIGTVYYFQANYPAALENYRKARELFSEVPNHYESAKALSGLALIYKETRRDAEALATLQQALKEFTALGDKEEIANTWSSIGTIYYGQRDFAAAAEAFLKSTEANSNPDQLVRVADALYMQGDYSAALSYYKQSFEGLKTKSDAAGMIAALNGAANSSFYQGNYDDALQFFQRNAVLQEQFGDKGGLATSLRGVGNVHRARGDFAAALESYFRSLVIFEQQRMPTGTTLGSIGLVRALQGDTQRALEYYGKALAEFEATANKIETARVHSLIGNVYYSQGNYVSALESYRKGLALRVEMEDKSGQGDILAGIGAALLKQGNYSEALDSYQQALELFNAVGNKERIADTLTRLSEAFLFQGEYSKALSAAENAASLARQLDSVDVLWYAVMLSGKAHRGLDHLPEATQAFADSISIVESLRSRPASIEGSGRSSHLPYLAALDLLVDQNRAGQAFDYAERAKVQALSELLRTSNAKTKKGLTPAEVTEEQRLAGEAASFELQLDREGQLRNSNDARRAKLRDRLSQTRAAFAEFREKLFTAHPHLKIERGELAPLQIEEIRSLLNDSQTALVEYTITENNSYLFVLTSDSSRAKNLRAKRSGPLSLKIYPLNVKNDELALRVREFEQRLASRSEDYSRSARELYDLLLKPAGDQLVLKTKLIVVPDGVLWRLPFEALQPADDHFVVDQMQVSYAPSFSALRDMRKATVTPRRNLQLEAFSMPVLTAQIKQRLELAYANRKFETTPQQEDEVRSIAGAYGNTRSQIFAGTAATEERVRTELSNAGILHFAAPALLDDTSAMSSFVSLAAGADNTDGVLQSREIMNLQTTAQLVVLSGAQSSGNYAGGAALGWSWSWFVAGSPTTMLTRWEVKSPALSQLMTQFYTQQRPDPRTMRPKSTALYQSVLKLRRSTEYQHPYYWANIAMIGDGR